MAGKNLVLDGFTFSNPSLKYLRDDVVLPKQGALMLIDPAHPVNPWASGVPADGAYLPNLALTQARALFGTVDTDAQPKMVKSPTFTGTAGLAERTTKGGLHAIAPQAGTALANIGAGITFPNKLMAYILANPKHDYYMSAWFRITRGPAAGYGNSQIVSINGSGQQTNSFLFNVAAPTATGPYPLRPSPSGNPPRLGFHEGDTSTLLGPKFVSIATDQWYSGVSTPDALPGDGTNQAVTGSFAGGGITMGAFGFWAGIGSTGVEGSGTFNPGSASGNKDKNASFAFYRFYLEDLTVSGRAYAEVDALSWSEYQKQILTAGGRYYGDAFTDPTTIP